jgi:hypothetical protein
LGPLGLYLTEQEQFGFHLREARPFNLDPKSRKRTRTQETIRNPFSRCQLPNGPAIHGFGMGSHQLSATECFFGRFDLTCHFHEGAMGLPGSSCCEKPPSCGTFTSNVGGPEW